MNAGYRFVPLSERVHREAHRNAVHDRRMPGTLSGTIDVTFHAEQPVHVGSGLKGLRDGVVVRRGTTVRGAPGLPGASMKGVLRARYEAITTSCAGQSAPRGEKVRSRSRPHVKYAKFATHIARYPVFEKCSANDLCAACALFGRMSLRSRVTVTDFAGDRPFVVEQMPEQYNPRAHHVGEAVVEDVGDKTQFLVRTLHGRKFACGRGPVVDGATRQRVEAVPAGTLLTGSLRIVNVEPRELGGLLAALGASPPSALKIGGGKGLGFGRIRLHSIAFHLRDHARAAVPADEARWRDVFRNWRERWPLGEDRLVEIHRGEP